MHNIKRSSSLRATYLAYNIFLYIQHFNEIRAQYKEIEIQDTQHQYGRPQWSRSLRHEMSSTAQTLRSWVLIPLRAWTFAFILCLCCPVYVAVLRRADPSSKESYRLSIKLRNLSETAFHGCYVLQMDNQGFLLFFSWGETESTWYCGHCLAYCTTPR
jgi:hypothetical protein